GARVGVQEGGAAGGVARVDGVRLGGLLLVVGHEGRLGGAEAPPQLTAQLERVEVLGVEVDRHQADLPGPVEQPPDRGPGHRQPPGDLVLRQLVLVVVPGHPEQEFLRAPAPRVVDTIWLHRITCPPSSGITAPVMNDDTGLSKSAIQRAASSASPIRPSGTWPASHRYASSRSSAQVAWIGVSIGPGAIALTRIRSGASSPATDWVR